MIILLSMVKNESAIIQRLLRSVKPHVDAIIVYDTGSTDTTVELATNFLQEEKIPGKVYTGPFINFGVSRTHSFLKCQEWVREMGWDAADTWALLLDGDMVLDAPLHPPSDPFVAGVLLKQRNSNLIYNNVRLIRCSDPWICKGATHEAWICPLFKKTIALSKPILIDHNDGGSKEDKFERDARLLLDDLSGNPQDPRTLFYLGQTYISLKDYIGAAVYLKKRIEIGGWEEEVYMARVYLGECYEAEGSAAEAVYEWITAWNSRPHRTEAAINLIQHYRKQLHSQFIAWTFLEKLLTNEKENTDILFVNERNLSYDVWQEYAILAFYVDKKEEARVKLDELNLSPSLSWHDANTLLGYFKWYMVPLIPVQLVRIQIPLSVLPWANENEASIWQPFNPSICVVGSKYYLNLRYANYSSQDGTTWPSRSASGKVITRNCLCLIEGNWNNPLSIEEIKLTGLDENIKSRVLGVEDCRFVQGSPSLEYLCTSISYSTSGIPTMFHLGRTGDGPWDITPMLIPPTVSIKEPQKNWLGFYHNGEFLYVYSWGPYRVCDMSGAVRVTYEYPHYTLNDYRGSANPVEWSSVAFPDEIYLCIVHKCQFTNGARYYYNRFVTLDKDLNPSRVSHFIRVTQENIEYWSGLCFSLEKNSYWVSYGVRECEAWLAEISKEWIEGALRYSLKYRVNNNSIF